MFTFSIPIKNQPSPNYQIIMQFVSAPEEGECLAKGADITFCHYTELDPPEWNMQYLAVVEEYVTCFGEDELGGENNLVRAEIAGLLVGIGKKYDILDTTDGVLAARITALGIASQMGELTSEEMAIVESTSAQTTSTSFMAKLRLKALDALDPTSFKAKKSLWLQSYERIKLVFEKKVVKILSPPVNGQINGFARATEILISD